MSGRFLLQAEKEGALTALKLLFVSAPPSQSTDELHQPFDISHSVTWIHTFLSFTLESDSLLTTTPKFQLLS